MAGEELSDRRLQDRAIRKGEVKGEEIEKRSAALPDSAENAEPLDSAGLAELREELATEKAVRDARIERQLQEPPERAPVATPVAGPLDAEL